jgi:ferredoxin-NADP reductase
MGRLSRHLREHARTGLIVDLTRAQGEFVLPDRRPESVLLVSGGSGITPVMAMLRTLCDESQMPQIGFLNYARSPLAALYEGELRRLGAVHSGVRVARGFTRSAGGQLTGRLCREHLLGVIDQHAKPAVFACGPPALVESVRAICASEGLAEPAIETFSGPAMSMNTEDARGVVRFAVSGREAPNTGLPLLEQAEDAGLTPEYGCRMGICNTCSCLKSTGTVRNVISGAMSTAGEEQIRICVSAPVGDVVLDI